MIDLQRYVREHPRAVDVAVALLLFAASGPGSRLTNGGSANPGAWWLAVLCAAIACTALVVLRRSHPRATVVVTAACAIAVAALGYLLTILLLAPVMAALYSLANRTDRNTTRAYALGATALLVATGLIAGPVGRSVYLETVSPAALLLLPAVLGSAVRLRRAYTGAVQARAEYAERTREEEARHRVAEERMRIARELHDVVAHHLALANAQAGTAAHLVRSRPDQAEKILGELTGTTSSALRELKATVGLLRQAGDPDAPLEPAPGLARLPDLTAALGTAGLTVTVSTEGEQRPLAPGVDLTAYRIVQEALTNVTKHATAGQANVRLAYSRDRLTIMVTDSGGGPAGVPAEAGAPGRGFGLIGMRERALAVGGRLQAGARPEGGFHVTAELPLHPRNLEEDLAR